MKKSKTLKVIVILLCGFFIFQQTGFAQVATVELNMAGHFASLHNILFPDKFRPLHLRCISYDGLNNNLKLLLDKGDTKNPKTQEIESATKDLLSYFFVGISLPNDAFWVNLRPDSPNDIIDSLLAQTEVGRILLEADIQLKKDTAQATSPETLEGKEYWNKLYQKAEELYGIENITIPTLTRPWIVPDEVILIEANDNAYVYKATLKVMLEQDYLKDSSVNNFKDERSKQLNEYSSQLIRELIIPKLNKKINASRKYAPLRQVYYSLILSQWFKRKFANQNSTYSNLINRKFLNNLTSKTPYSKDTYFKEYQKSFKNGEYNIKESVYAPYGQTIRSYFSGGVAFEAMLVNSPIENQQGIMPNVEYNVGFLVKGDPGSLILVNSEVTSIGKLPEEQRASKGTYPKVIDEDITVLLKNGDIDRLEYIVLNETMLRGQQAIAALETIFYDEDSAWQITAAVVKVIGNIVVKSSNLSLSQQALLGLATILNREDMEEYLTPADYSNVVKALGNIAVKSSSPSLSQQALILLETILNKKGLHPYRYAATVDVIRYIADKRKDFTVSRTLACWQVYSNPRFQELAANIHEHQRYSFALSTYYFLQQHGLDVSNQDNIAKVVDFLWGKRERSSPLEVFSKNTNRVVNIVHQEERFNISKMELLERKSGVRPEVITSRKGASEKSNVLEDIGKSRGNLAIFFNGHGGRKHLWLDRGLIDGELSDDLNYPFAISYEEIGDKLIDRGDLGNVTILLSSCYSFNFSVNLLNYLKEKGIKESPIIISSSNFDHTSYGDNFLDALISLNTRNNESLIIEDIFTAENNEELFISEDVAVFSPLSQKEEDSVRKLVESCVKAGLKTYAAAGVQRTVAVLTNPIETSTASQFSFKLPEDIALIGFEGTDGQISTGNLEHFGVVADIITNLLWSGKLVLSASVINGQITIEEIAYSINGKNIAIKINNSQQELAIPSSDGKVVFVNLQKANSIFVDKGLTNDELIIAARLILIHEITEAYALQLSYTLADSHYGAMMAGASYQQQQIEQSRITEATSDRIRLVMSEILAARDRRDAILSILNINAGKTIKLSESNSIEQGYGVSIVSGYPFSDGLRSVVSRLREDIEKVVPGIVNWQPDKVIHGTLSAIIRTKKDGQRVTKIDLNKIDIDALSESIAKAQPYNISFNKININADGNINLIGESNSSELVRSIAKALPSDGKYTLPAGESKVEVYISLGYILFDKLLQITSEQAGLFKEILSNKYGNINLTESVEQLSIVYYSHRTLRRIEKITTLKLGRSNKELIKEFFSDIDSTPPMIGPSNPGGIDFRFLPIVAQSMDNLKASISAMPRSSLQRINLNQEWSDIERLVNSGIIPSAERLKEYLAVSFFKGNLDNDMEKIVSCIADILRIQEESCRATDSTLKDILVVLGSGRSGEELKIAFGGGI